MCGVRLAARSRRPSAPLQYVQTGPERMRIEVIGQRLLTGRLAIAQAALLHALTLHRRTETHAQHKVCNGLAGETTLAEMPQLRAVLRESYAALDRLVAYAAAVEERLSDCLRRGTIPDADLVEAIAVCKIKCIEVRSMGPFFANFSPISNQFHTFFSTFPRMYFWEFLMTQFPSFPPILLPFFRFPHFSNPLRLVG